MNKNRAFGVGLQPSMDKNGIKMNLKYTRNDVRLNNNFFHSPVACFRQSDSESRRVSYGSSTVALRGGNGGANFEDNRSFFSAIIYTKVLLRSYGIFDAYSTQGE